MVSELLSAQQRRLWVLEQLEHASAARHLVFSTKVHGALDAERLAQAVRLIEERHDILNSCFQMVNDEPRVVQCANFCEAFTIVDLASVIEDNRQESVRALIRAEQSKGFDLHAGRLMRAVLCRLASDENLLVIILHSIVCDRVSAGLLAKEIAAAYESIGAGKPLPPPPFQYSEYSRSQEQYLSSGAQAADLAYWTQTVANATFGLELPTDPARANSPRQSSEEQKIVIAGEDLDALRAFAKGAGTSIFVTLLTAFFCLLGRYTGAEDIIIGTEVSGRKDPSLADVVGPVCNQLVLRAPYSADATFRDMLPHIAKVWSDAGEHQALPFGTLLDALHTPRDITRHPLFQVSFSEAMPTRPVDAAGLHWEPVHISTGAGMLDLAVEIIESSVGLEARFSYSSELFEYATIARMMGHFLNLVRSAMANPEQAVSALSMLTDSERHQLIVEWNQAPREYRPDKCIHQIVETQVARTPDAVAVSYEGRSLTYEELNRRANQLAHYLARQGVGPETLVAMCMERSLDMIVGILGILKAGGAYLPLDLSYPSDRLSFMIEDARPPVVITQKDLEAKLPQHRAEIVCVDRDWPAIARESGDNLTSGVGPQNLAYVIYTSGSTGKPKGCQVTHFNVVRLFQATWDWYQFDESDVWTMFHSYAFDFSVWEIWGALFYGGRVVVVPYLVSRSPEAFYRLLAGERVTVLNQTPSAFRQLIVAEESVGAHDLSLRYVIFGGEALEMQSLKPWYQRHGDQKPVLVNMYGITETTVHVTYRPLSAADTDRGSVIGRPIPDLQLYVLDPHREPVPIGVAGEMYVGGSGVARGYLSRPELTAQRFIADPFRTEPGARLYKTGDLARFLSNGDMEYLGRIDHQVKIRGFRIELGEIESVLTSHPAVHQCLVMAREDNPGDKRLVAYVVPKSNQKPSVSELRAHIRQSLPDYMVPNAFSFLSTFPLTPTGKIDRRALPAPVQEERDESALIAPRNEMEELLLSIFQETLRVDSISVTDDFFELGGQSLMAARLASQIHAATGHSIQLADLFRAATVESLARLIQQESDADPDPIVMQIKRGDGSRMPFFAIVPPGEEALGYAILARHMGPEQTVYKIQGHSPVTRGERPYSEEEMTAMAHEYVEAMRRVQPEGPYCVGGMCDGVHIAERVVLKLEAEGDEVGLFAIFDTWVLQNSQRRWLWTLDYYGQRLREIGKLNFSERLASYKRVAQSKVQNLVGAKSARTDWRRAYWPEDFTPPRFQAPIILFKRPKQPFYYVDDPHMGWSERTTTGVEVHEVEFSHLEILREPHIRIFGKNLSERMARVANTAFAPNVG